jgi:hypothetical protein
MEIPVSQKNDGLLKVRIISAVLSVALAAAGFLMWKYYRGWAEFRIRFFISGIVYVMLWSAGLFALLPGRKNIWRIPLIVFVLTCGLEFLQLYRPPFLQAVRATLIGAAILGTDFLWSQFPYYIAGAFLSYLTLKLIYSLTYD